MSNQKELLVFASHVMAYLEKAQGQRLQGQERH